MTEATASKEITVTRLYNDFLCDVDFKLDTALTLVNILNDDHFAWNEKKIQEDKLEQFNYLNSYKEIQTLIISIREFLFQASTTMEAVMNIQMKDIKPFVPEKESA